MVLLLADVWCYLSAGRVKPWQTHTNKVLMLGVVLSKLPNMAVLPLQWATEEHRHRTRFVRWTRIKSVLKTMNYMGFVFFFPSNNAAFSHPFTFKWIKPVFSCSSFSLCDKDSVGIQCTCAQAALRCHRHARVHYARRALPAWHRVGLKVWWESVNCRIWANNPVTQRTNLYYLFLPSQLSIFTSLLKWPQNE